MLRIDINGPVGCGKTHLAEKLEKLLQEEGYTVVLNHDNQWSDSQVDHYIQEAVEKCKPIVLITDGGICRQTLEQAKSQLWKERYQKENEE